ncbi:MAG: phosphatidylserine decarboxylase [candidate division Zixibacteria bacterium RBG_16_48_11]|nr:MAG: phosphatidylserine decarboxylase [candidate division Zixibacteria bacterium RBG_16_48_11]
MIAKEGLGLILAGVVISILLFGLTLLTRNRAGLILASLSALATLFLLYFFRDPERIIPTGQNLIVSPADGRVLEIEPVAKNDFIGSAGTKISVFLSPLDVHVIRSPMEGKVEYAVYKKGSFKAAYKNEASLQNENLELGISASRSRLILRQIAGFLARRIACSARQCDQLARGARLGVIKFGSRVELILPVDVDLKISPQQKVRAGETIIGVFK